MRVIFIFILLPLLANTQTIITADDFLSNSLLSRQTKASIKTENVNFPWLEKIDLRSETRDFDLNEQEYTLRLSPSTPKIIKAQKELYNHIISIPDFENDKQLCNQILVAHKDWIRLYMINEETKLLNVNKSILSDEQKVLERQMSAFDFDFDELIKATTDKSDVEIKINNLATEKSSIDNRYQNIGVYDFSNFVNIDIIEKNVKSSLIITPKNPRDEYEEKLIDKEIALEKAEGKQIVDFAQFRYQGPHDNLIQERLSIGFGISIPYSGNRILKIKELELEKDRIQRDYKWDIHSNISKAEKLKSEILASITSIQDIRMIWDIERKELLSLARELSKKSGSNPLTILEIEKRHNETLLRDLRMKENILVDYLKYMEEIHLLCASNRNILRVE